ncbi:hypothetical protein P8452_40198 [Trifolium repens]|nr:hypothetical protein P8452_40198 [Trifolium repens]
MLFVIDLSTKQAVVSDSTYRVKRVCLDPVMIESFCVGVWFEYVVEGVDLWFVDDQTKDIPKFRMEMKVKHGVMKLYSQFLTRMFGNWLLKPALFYYLWGRVVLYIQMK